MCSKESAKPRRREKEDYETHTALVSLHSGDDILAWIAPEATRKKITSKNKLRIYLIKIFSVSRNPITSEWQAALCSDFLSCKCCIYALALTCQPFTIFFRELPFCLLHGYCFYPENREKESPFHVGHPFSRPSVLQISKPILQQWRRMNSPSARRMWMTMPSLLSLTPRASRCH